MRGLFRPQEHARRRKIRWSLNTSSSHTRTGLALVQDRAWGPHAPVGGYNYRLVGTVGWRSTQWRCGRVLLAQSIEVPVPQCSLHQAASGSRPGS